MIRLSGIEKSYNQESLLSIPFRELSDNLIWLKGTNGSGKTTLMKMIGGFNSFAGDIEINAMSIKKQPVSYRQVVNYAEAEPLFPPFLSGYDLIQFHQQVRNGRKNETESLIETFAIGGYYKNSVSTYSSGMIKRLSLAIGFIGNPQVILLDEPLVTLDIESQKRLYALIQEKSKRGTQIIYTSHQLPDDPFLKSAVAWAIQNKELCRE